MSRNWIMAFVALAVWGGTFAWYVIGIGRVGATLMGWLRRLLPRRPPDRSPPPG